MVKSNDFGDGLIFWSIPFDFLIYDFQIALIVGFDFMFLDSFMRYAYEQLPLSYYAHVEA